MDFLQPTSWDDALAAKAARPEAVPIAGGTDVMVEINFDARRPAAMLDLTRVPDLARWTSEAGRIRLGAGVSYARVIGELGDRLPGLAMAARTVGSPQIRNRGTVGGNLGAASPAGDSHPPLLAVGAEIEVASVRGVRTIPVADFYTGVKRNALAEDELIAAILIPQAAGPQQFSKIGTRNAMVIAVASFCIYLNARDRTVGTGIGSDAAARHECGALPGRGPGRGQLVGLPRRSPGIRRHRVRRKGASRRVPGRRRQGHGQLPAPWARGHGQAYADLGLDRLSGQC